MLLVVSVAALTVACSDSRVPAPDAVDLTTKDSVSQKLTVNVFVDASGSMKGFVKDDRTSYKTVVEQIESVFVAKWPTSKVNYYKFATRVLEIKKREDLANAVYRDFYRDKGFHEETRIYKLTERDDICEKNTLSIIITDLEQDKYLDRMDLIKGINNKCISRGYSVGIGGVNSRFNDNVTSSDKRFYIVALGSHANIEELFNQVIRQFDKIISKENMTVFSPTIIEQPLTFPAGSIIYGDKVVEDRRLVKPNSKDGKLQHEVIRQFLVRKNATANVITKLNYSPVEYRVPFKVDTNPPPCNKGLSGCKESGLIENNKTIERYVAKNGFREVKDIADAFSVNSMLCADNNKTMLALRLDLNAKKLNSGSVYRLSLELKPSGKAFKDVGKWWKNKKSTDTSALAAEDFIDKIEQIFQDKQPKLGKVYFYFKKD
ncbi:MAG: hypothetical protein HQL04_07735 [Nitrospirae bacterium]|nr:hypothetical protein [Nitrospirota bacterium]